MRLVIDSDCDNDQGFTSFPGLDCCHCVVTTSERANINVAFISEISFRLESKTPLHIFMYIVDQSKLLKGDILLTRENSLTSKIVQLGTFSKYSHAILYLGDSSFIHSDSIGVHSGNLQRLLFNDASKVVVLRLKREEDHAHIDNICSFARTQVGMQYSVPQATASVVRGARLLNDESNRQYCSRLVAQSYKAGSLILVPNPDFCYPKELEKSTHLTVVSGCVRRATQAEIEFAESESPIEVQTRITNTFLAQARQIASEDLQTFEQVVDLLLRRQELDDALSKALVKSGYLKFWQLDVHRNPWRYSVGELRNSGLPKVQQIETAKRELRSAKSETERFQQMHTRFQERWRFIQLRYFMLNINLYKKLIDLQNLRIAVAEDILQHQ